MDKHKVGETQSLVSISFGQSSSPAVASRKLCPRLGDSAAIRPPCAHQLRAHKQVKGTSLSKHKWP